MIPGERKKNILDYLNTKNFASTNELAKEMYVSEPTIRRDLIELEKQRLIIRIHGGATLAKESNSENSYILRENENIDKKSKLAELAVTFIDDGYTIFLDSSSTVNKIIPYLSSYKDITVITNGLKNAIDLSEYPRINTIITGGSIFQNSTSVIGSKALNFVSDYHVDICLVSCRGADNDGLYEANEPQAIIKQKMLRNSKTKILLIDSSKSNNKCFYFLADYSTFDYVITDNVSKFSPYNLNNDVQFIEANGGDN